MKRPTAIYPNILLKYIKKYGREGDLPAGRDPLA
jgi:hypothetical protein